MKISVQSIRMANAIKYSCLLGINYPHTIACLISISLLCHKYCMSFLLSLSLTQTHAHSFFAFFLYSYFMFVAFKAHVYILFSEGNSFNVRRNPVTKLLKMYISCLKHRCRFELTLHCLHPHPKPPPLPSTPPTQPLQQLSQTSFLWSVQNCSKSEHLITCQMSLCLRAIL